MRALTGPESPDPGPQPERHQQQRERHERQLDGEGRGPLWTEVAVIVRKKVDQVAVAPGATADSTAERKALVLMTSANTPTAIAAASQSVPRAHDGTMFPRRRALRLP